MLSAPIAKVSQRDLRAGNSAKHVTTAMDHIEVRGLVMEDCKVTGAQHGFCLAHFA